MFNENSVNNESSAGSKSNDSLKGVSVDTHSFAVSHLLSPALKGNDFNYNYNSTDYSLRAIVDIVCKHSLLGFRISTVTIFFNTITISILTFK